ncbi:YchJ family metal-binding protein [Vibrio sp. PP-XX7]
MKKCICGSQRHYKNCCQPIHLAHECATTPEQLMRARYSAYALGLVDFIIATYHSSNRARHDRAGIIDGTQNQWSKLVILQTDSGSTSNEGFVHFKAYFQQHEQSYCLQERSRFIRENGLWYYVDGEISE